ncbi:MAG: GIY-YIG nuclease family protein [Bacteroidota bacterium]
MGRFYVYILTNRHHTVFYTGFTDDLERRVYEHKHRLLEGFTKKYNCDKFVYYEEFITSEEALHREKQIKRYRRDWKKNLINSINPQWRDLYQDFLT